MFRHRRKETKGHYKTMPRGRKKKRKTKIGMSGVWKTRLLEGRRQIRRARQQKGIGKEDEVFDIVGDRTLDVYKRQDNRR